MQKCSKCNHENAVDARFCSQCATALVQAPATNAAKPKRIYSGSERAVIGIAVVIAVGVGVIMFRSPAAPSYSTPVATVQMAQTFDPKVPHPGVYARNAPELQLPLNDRHIIQLFGKPSSTQSFGTDGDQLWYYSNVTYDPITDKIDKSVQVVIHNTAVKAINFY